MGDFVARDQPPNPARDYEQMSATRNRCKIYFDEISRTDYHRQKDALIKSKLNSEKEWNTVSKVEVWQMLNSLIYIM